MNKVSVFVSAKTLTPVDCVKLQPAQTYTDNIVKGQEYIDFTTIGVAVTNYCNQSFTITETQLFSDTVGGGNFVAKFNAFTIGANQTLNIPVVYNGIYLGSNLAPSYNIVLNGIQNIYNLLVSVPVVNQPPVVSDIILNIANKGLVTFTMPMFVSHFFDIDGDTIATVKAEGDVTGYQLSSAPYVSGTEVTRLQIESGLFKYQAPDTNSVVNSIVVWKARDTAGNISL